MHVKTIKTDLFRLNQNLFDFIVSHVTLKEDDILVVTSKIVALAEGAVVDSKTIDKKSLVARESDKVLCESYKTYLTIKDGILLAAAGIDESNAEGGVYILLPKDSFKTARELWEHLRRHFGLKNLGVIFTDSRCSPMRKGVTGVAISWWGFRGVKSHVGNPDLFGRPLTMSSTNIVDGLASAAVVIMGEANEQTPLAVISEFPAEFADWGDPHEVMIPPEQDIFGPILKY